MNCGEKGIIMNSPGKELIVCFENTITLHVLIISVVEVSTLLMKEWSDYLAYFMDGKKVT